MDRRTIVIEPRFSGLDWAKGVCVTEFGPVEIDWKIKGARRPEVVCTIPENVQAKLDFAREMQAMFWNSTGWPRLLAARTDGLEAVLQSGKHTIRFHP